MHCYLMNCPDNELHNTKLYIVGWFYHKPLFKEMLNGYSSF